MIATKLEEKLRHYRCLPENSKERAQCVYMWKPFFSDIADKIKEVQVGTNEPVFEGRVRSWLNARRISPNEVCFISAQYFYWSSS